MADNPQQMWSDYDSNSSRLGSAASFFGDSMSHSSGILTENSSLFSMSEDDFDHLATLRAREMFDEVDKILYENSDLGSLEITRECDEWKSKFPHLRIVGQKMFDSTDNGYRRYSPADVALSLTNPKMVLTCSDMTGFVKGLSVKGEKMNSQLQSSRSLSFDGEETFDLDGEFEEIFALDYNSEEKRSMQSTSSGYPPITPINSIKDFILSSLSNAILSGISKHVVNLVLQCSKRQTILPDERSKGKENVKVIEDSNMTCVKVVLPSKQPSSNTLRSRNLDDSSSMNFHHINPRSFSFKPSGLQVVPEDSRLDAILTVRQMRNERNGDVVSPFSSPRLHHDNNNNKRVSSQLENSKTKSSFHHLSTMDPSPRALKTSDNMKTLIPRSNQMKHPLPRIQQKPLTASNNNFDRLTQPKNCLLSKSHQGLRTCERVKSLTSINHDFHQSSLQSQSLNSISCIKNNSGKAGKNFIQENIRKVSSSRKVLKPRDPVVSCPDPSRNKIKRCNEMPSNGIEKSKVLPELKRDDDDDDVKRLQRIPFVTGNHKFVRFEPLRKNVKCETPKNMDKESAVPENLKLEMNEDYSMKRDVMNVFDGLKIVNHEALNVCRDLKSSCKCLRQISHLLREICVALNDEKY